MTAEEYFAPFQMTLDDIRIFANHCSQRHACALLTSILSLIDARQNANSNTAAEGYHYDEWFGIDAKLDLGVKVPLLQHVRAAGHKCREFLTSLGVPACDCVQ